MNESQLGAWGEHLVIAELLQRGFCVNVPVVDVSGYDVLITTETFTHWRLQIKTCRQPAQKQHTIGYRFNARSKRGSDFYILCCLFHRSFYIIPTCDMPVAVTLSGDGSGNSKLEKYFQAFHLLSNESSNKVQDAGIKVHAP